ncbi:hypothetical protein SAMN05421749_10255 [Acinetobacter marinus]|uniref:Uncharacterized protein n=1 Tax=Acinetobacter marinus TaxID=281375 RepID=A0A1G6HB92_9GAMM|nr:hypothetical protein SAMN05421749_10255 [Acinetobacter marinus]
MIINMAKPAIHTVILLAKLAPEDDIRAHHVQFHILSCRSASVSTC